MNEQLWSESSDTAKGRIEHERVHSQRVERRGSKLKLYEYEVFSETMGIRGKCDCIEAYADETGCRIPAADFPVRLYPVEFKHGKVREEEEYELQLCAQAMCLEEMYQTSIPEAALFYTSSHRRYPVQLAQQLRNRVLELLAQLLDIKKNYRLPAAVYSAKCKKCSLREHCMPQWKRSAVRYCSQVAKEAKGMEIT